MQVIKHIHIVVGYSYNMVVVFHRSAWAFNQQCVAHKQVDSHSNYGSTYSVFSQSDYTKIKRIIYSVPMDKNPIYLNKLYK